jgi:site-specific DNA-cytosine methylase
MQKKYKQVGNAVPPLMAFAVADAIKKFWLYIKTKNKLEYEE